jgi:hypothetical protein
MRRAISPVASFRMMGATGFATMPITNAPACSSAPALTLAQPAAKGPKPAAKMGPNERLMQNSAMCPPMGLPSRSPNTTARRGAA